MENNVPAGYHFVPLDEELIIHYLGNTEKGLPLPSNMVVVRNLYDGDPWEVFNDGDPWTTKMTREKKGDKLVKVESVIYVITELKKEATKKKPKESKNVSRTAGCGAWHGETSTEDIYDPCSNRLIGFKKMFTFEITNVGPDSIAEGHWIMHELTTSRFGAKYAICEIKRDHSKPTKIAPLKRRNNKNAANNSDGVVTVVDETEEKEVHLRKRGRILSDMEVSDPQGKKKMCHGHDQDAVGVDQFDQFAQDLFWELRDDQETPCLDSESMISDQPCVIQENQCLPPNTAFSETMEQPTTSYFHHIHGVTDQVAVEPMGFESSPEFGTSLPSGNNEYFGEQQNGYRPCLDFESDHESAPMSSAQLPTVQDSSQFLPPNTALDASTTASSNEVLRSLGQQQQPLSSEIGFDTTNCWFSDEYMTMPDSLLSSPNSAFGYGLRNQNTRMSADDLFAVDDLFPIEPAANGGEREL